MPWNLFSVFLALIVILVLWNLYFASLAGPSLPIHVTNLPENNVQSSGKFKSTSTRRQPTHHACDGYQGIYHIAMGDIGGAAGTIFFQFVIAQLLYAQAYRLKPWIHFTNTSYIIYDPNVHGKGSGVKFKAMVGRNATRIVNRKGHWRDVRPGPPDVSMPVHQETLHFDGNGVWEDYFEPVSDFVPGDASCENKIYVTLDLKLITPGLHGFSGAPRAWRYTYLPDYITQPHIPITQWLESQRFLGHLVAKRYIQIKQYLHERAHLVNPNCSVANSCLGLHIRHSDKAAGRRQVETHEFLPYVQAFVRSGGQHVYLATDSARVLDEIFNLWPSDITEKLRSMKDIVRSNDEKAVFDIGSHHRTNQEVLVEIIALSQCQFLVHGFSAVSESAIWINYDLHRRGVNLEDPEKLSPILFETLVQMVLRGEPHGNLPRPTRTFEWWKTPPMRTTANKTIINHTACQHSQGILLISSTGKHSGVARAFFTDVLNQLLYADENNFVPYIHINENNQNIYDSEVHFAPESNITLKGLKGVAIEKLEGFESGRAHRISEKLSPGIWILGGSGIWDSYFEPLSPFVSQDTSCQGKPLFEINQTLVDLGIGKSAPWVIRPWRFDGVTSHLWNPDAYPFVKWIAYRRQRAHDIVRKYFRFHPKIIRQAKEVNPADSTCLAVHFRNGDKKGQYRRKVGAREYLPYIEAFYAAGGRSIFVASDSNVPLVVLSNILSADILKTIRTQGQFVVRLSKKVRDSSMEWPLHLLDRHHRVNSEALVDIYAMSRCKMILHTYSTLAEAAIYVNLELHNNSVNLEDPNRMTPSEFESVAKSVISNDERYQASVPRFNAATLPEKVALENATIVSSNKLENNSNQNAIVYLAQKKHSSYGRDSYSILLRSLTLLHDNYLSQGNNTHNVDIFIFHTGDFDESDITIIESKTLSNNVRLVNLASSRFWTRPKQHEHDDPNSWYAYPLFSEGYRKMMHWFAIGIWDFFDSLNKQKGCKYRYLFRLDEDSYLHSPIRYDIFDLMKTNSYVYGFRMCAYEMKVVRNMWKMWNKRHTDFAPQRDIDLNMCGVYNNFFVADLEFFTSKPVQTFLQFIHHQGHIYRRRLGDLMIHSMTIYGFARPEQIHRFLDFTYEHSTLNQTTGCLTWGGIQGGYQDKNATNTLTNFYQQMILARNCTANLTYIPEPDLSPTYQHIPVEWKKRVSLLTITAGKVELPGQGFLSG